MINDGQQNNINHKNMHEIYDMIEKYLGGLDQ